ncbi:MAG: DNA alkylation repair protein [Nanoarchaeota archaeon]|nr:DNA alkylation repair protein [Nanoarchaeota archaeon]
MGYQNLIKDFQKLKNPKKVAILSSFFKTGKGEYGEGDVFLGLTVPQQRLFVKKYLNLKLKDLELLLSSKVHEFRLTSLLILVAKYKKADEARKKEIFDFYLKNTKNINNWDLVDLSAPNIIGQYLLDKDKSVLIEMAKSKDLWKKRISILASYAFIKENQFDYTFQISKLLLSDKHDLIHKAVGWMLREAGKRNQDKEEIFLKKYYKTMPRTMLRYAIEKFDDNKRKFYLGKN